MPADPALTARLIEAAALGVCSPGGRHKCARMCSECRFQAEAALAAAVREAGLDADVLRAVARGNEWHADNLAGAGFSAAPASYDRTAALLRALAEIADG